MVYLFVPIVIYLCIGIADGLRYIMNNSSQDAPVLQLFIAFIWGLMWPLRASAFRFNSSANHIEERASHAE